MQEQVELLFNLQEKQYLFLSQAVYQIHCSKLLYSKLNILRDFERKQLMHSWRIVVQKRKSLALYLESRKIQRYFKKIKMHWLNAKRSKDTVSILQRKKKKRLFRSMSDLLTMRKRLKQALRVLKISRRIKAKDKYFTEWHNVYSMSKNARFFHKKKQLLLKKCLLRFLSTYLNSIKLAKISVNSQYEKNIKNRYLIDWMILARRSRKVNTMQEKCRIRLDNKIKKKYFGQWIKLQLQIQAMRCWQHERIMKQAFKGLLKNMEYNQIKTQMYYMAQNKRALFTIKTTFSRWKTNVAHIKLERHVKGTFVKKRNESLLKRSFYGWRIWLQEAYKLFQQKKLSEEIYEFKLGRKAWNLWEKYIQRQKRDRTLFNQLSQNHRYSLIDSYFSRWIQRFNRHKILEQKYFQVQQVSAILSLKKYLGVWNRAYLQLINRDIAVDRLLNRSLTRKAYNGWAFLVSQRIECANKLRYMLHKRAFNLQVKSLSSWKVYYSMMMEKQKRNQLASGCLVRNLIIKSWRSFLFHTSLSRKYKYLRLKFYKHYLKKLMGIWRTKLLQKKGCGFYQHTRIIKLKRHILLYWKERMVTKVSKRLALISAKTINERVVKAKVIIFLNLYKKKKQEEKLIKEKADMYCRFKMLNKYIQRWTEARKKETHDQELVTGFLKKQEGRKLLFMWNSWVRRTRRDFSSLNRKQALYFKKLERKIARKYLRILNEYSGKQIYLRHNLQNFTNYRLSFLCKRILQSFLSYSQWKKQQRVDSSVATNKYRLNLISRAFGGLGTYATNRRYFKEKKEELTQIHTFCTIRQAYCSWRECFVQEIMSRQANQTADQFYLALCKKKFLRAMSKNVVDKNVTRDLCMLGGQHFEEKSKQRALKTISIYSKLSLLQHYQNQVVDDFLLRKGWNLFRLGFENQSTLKARYKFATQLWEKSFKKKCFTAFNQLAQNLKAIKEIGRIISLKHRERRLNEYMSEWCKGKDKVLRLKETVLSKVKRDSSAFRKEALRRWKNFITEVDMRAKADVFHAKVICPNILNTRFKQWRILFEKIQTEFRFEYMSSSFWIEKTIKVYFKILKDYWKKKKALHSKESIIANKYIHALQMQTLTALKAYNSQRIKAKRMKLRAQVMHSKNVKTKVLAALLINLDLMARSHKVTSKNFYSVKMSCFTQWKQKFLNRITQKQNLRRVFSFIKSNTALKFFSRLRNISHLSIRLLNLDGIRQKITLKDGFKGLNFNKILSLHISKLNRRNQRRIKEKLFQAFQENKERDQSIRELNQVKLQGYEVEKEDILLRLCIDLWRKYTDLKKLSAKSIGSYCLRLLRNSLKALKNYSRSEGKCKTLIYERAFITKRVFLHNWEKRYEKSRKISNGLAKIENLKKHRSLHLLIELHNESKQQDSLEPETLIHSRCLLLKAMASIHRYYLKRLQFKIKHTKIEQNHSSLLAREAFYTWILALKQRYEITKAQTIESHRLIKKVMMAWKRSMFQRFKKRNFIKNLQVILENRPVLRAPFLKLKHLPLNKAWNSLKQNVEIQKLEDVKNSKAIFLLYNKYLNKGFFALKANWADSQKNRLVHKMYEIKILRKSLRKWEIYLMSRRRQTEKNLKALSFAFQKYQRKAFFAFLLNSVQFKNEKLAAKKSKK